MAVVDLSWVKFFVRIANNGCAEFFDGCQEVLLCALTQPDYPPVVVLDVLCSLLIEVDQ